MKINDVRVLRNIIGDKAVDDDGNEDVLKRKIPKMEMKKLEIGRLPAMSIPGIKSRTPTSIARDMVGKNYVDPEKKRKVEGLTDKEYKDYSEEQPRIVNTDTEQSKRQADIEKFKADTQYEEKRADYLRSKAKADILEAYTKPRPVEPTSMKIFQKEGKGGISIPTMAGVRQGYKEFQKIAAPMTERLSYSAGGAVMGEFGDEASGRKVNVAISNRQRYLQYLFQKYMKKGYRVNSEADLYPLINYKERQRINELTQGISKAQNLASNRGFMSGSGGGMIIGRSRSQVQNANIPQMTQIGRSTTVVGSFGPETLSRLGVTQSITSRTPENKWGVLFEGESRSSTDKITQILGKSPQPVPVKSKMDKYIKVLDTEKIKKFI